MFIINYYHRFIGHTSNLHNWTVHNYIIKDIIMPLIANTTNAVGSTTVVSLYNLDKNNPTISFALTKDSQ